MRCSGILVLCRGAKYVFVIGYGQPKEVKGVNQEKIGGFLKALRVEKRMTQEQLAERLGVNHRTVSRWETGRTMPDFALLIELGRFYGVTVDELLDGERKEAPASEEKEKTVEKIADYTEQEKQALARRLNRLLSFGTAVLALSALLQYMEWESPFCRWLAGFGQGAALGLLLLGVLMTSRFGPRIRAVKQHLLGRQK